MAKTKKHPNEMSFLDHLEELRWHLIRSTLAVVIIGSVAFLMKDFMFGTVIFGPMQPDFPTYEVFCNLSKLLGFSEAFCETEPIFTVQSREMAEQFSAHIWTSIWAGFIIGFPFVLWEMWRFVAPGLHANERKNARGFIFIASFLFFLGVLFGYYVVAPLSINFLGGYSISDTVVREIDLSSYIATVRAAVLACGFVFELPIIIYFLTKIGVVTPEILKKYRKISLVVVLILSAIITPPDVASQIIVAVPILILYQISIYISRMVIKKEAKRARKNG